ncbi:MAG: class I SAM-dependent methyltransferase [Myxococcaceae bacterium]|nr:class I SAM-dependent methyltransferase [Myxococcaceae bacterium]
MSKNEALEASYQNPLIGHGYDALSWLIYSPLGGRETLRREALDAVGVAAGQRVLELGCGSGGLTRRLVERGARVTSVDWSGPMLRLARTRAPAATFVRSELTAFVPAETFDLVLFAFVLHELEPGERAAALRVARAAIGPGSRLAVVDHAEPARGAVARGVFKLMVGFEPRSMSAWARGGFDDELGAAGFAVETSTSLARGTARVVTARVLVA